MAEIKLSAEQTARIVPRLQDYFTDKLDVELGRFDAEFLLDFFASEIGVYYYNQAINDAHKMLHTQIDSVSEHLLELEKWTPPDR